MTNVAVDITGQRFGRWVALSFISSPKGRFWRCICDCGAVRYVGSGRLRDGSSKSCGCSWKLTVEERKRRKRVLDRRHADRWKKSNTKKVWAQRRLGAAVDAGRIKRMPCEVCGEPRAQGHHDDYDRPLDVRWLCVLHHHQWHVANGEGKNAHGPLPPGQPKTSKYRGVFFNKKPCGGWRMSIKIDGRQHCRVFRSEEEAARAYDEKAIEFFGDRAILNFPRQRSVA